MSFLDSIIPKDEKTKRFIANCRKIHGDRYDYGPTHYMRAHDKTRIRCKLHGIFEQRAIAHKRGSGCPNCKNRLTQEQFIKECHKIHGNRYDYSKTNYTSSRDKIVITCVLHGDFLQLASGHKRGKGCPKCGKRRTTEQFIKECKEVHGDRYDYSKTKYVNWREKVCISCFKHGDFFQCPVDHKRGHGCPICLGKKTTEQFVKECRRVHGNKYDYSKTEYEGSDKKICVNCYKHGLFFQLAGHHKNGIGCPHCASSKGEKEIGYILKKHNVRFRTEKSFDDCCSPLTSSKLKFDFWLYELDTLIEYQGMQHFAPVEYFGGILDFAKRKLHDYTKNKWAKKRGFTLLEPDYKIPLNQLESWLLKRLNFARSAPKKISMKSKLKGDEISTQTSIFDIFRNS